MHLFVGLIMPIKQEEIERIRLEQWELLHSIEGSVAALRHELLKIRHEMLKTGKAIKPDVEELSRIANYLAENI